MPRIGALASVVSTIGIKDTPVQAMIHAALNCAGSYYYKFLGRRLSCTLPTAISSALRGINLVYGYKFRPK
ncbi:MAG TPA: hypothetical protein VK206_17225, partial [Anaerolineales bacterium]|nr:hypothetical protein [Anaerolineales bacterium]